VSFCSFGCGTAAAVPGQLNTRPSGFIGGGQIGYNWQTGLFVWGVETDFQGANIKGDASVTNSSTFDTSVTGPDSTTVMRTGSATVTGAGSQKIEWFGTLRGRLGWTPTPPLLIYATGGLAYAHVKTDVSFAESGSVAIVASSGLDVIFSQVGPFSGATALTKDDTRAGWTVGGGAEWMFAPQWSIKAEYLYYDLGTVGIDQTLNTFNTFGSFITSTGIHSEAHYHGSIVRGGVNFKFY
jgi:outer membrane immunogenic protein